MVNRRNDVIKWKLFPRYWPFVWGIHRWREIYRYYLIDVSLVSKQIVEWPVIRDYVTFIWRRCNEMDPHWY